MKKKKKKKAPINLDKLDAVSNDSPSQPAAKTEEAPPVTLQAPVEKEKSSKPLADDMDLDDFSNLKKKKKKKRTQPLLDMDGLNDALQVSHILLILTKLFLIF